MTTKHSSKDLGHLGIVSVVCDQIGLVEAIDQIIPPDPRSEITTGESVKLMIINGLGFSSKPLYLESMFFNCRPVKRFLNRECNSDQITDDRLGRALDRCYETNCTTFFATIATKASMYWGGDPFPSLGHNKYVCTWRLRQRRRFRFDRVWILHGQKIRP